MDRARRELSNVRVRSKIGVLGCWFRCGYVLTHVVAQFHYPGTPGLILTLILDRARRELSSGRVRSNIGAQVGSFNCGGISWARGSTPFSRPRDVSKAHDCPRQCALWPGGDQIETQNRNTKPPETDAHPAEPKRNHMILHDVVVNMPLFESVLVGETPREPKRSQKHKVTQTRNQQNQNTPGETKMKPTRNHRTFKVWL